MDVLGNSAGAGAVVSSSGSEKRPLNWRNGAGHSCAVELLLKLAKDMDEDPAARSWNFHVFRASELKEHHEPEDWCPDQPCLTPACKIALNCTTLFAYCR